MICTTSVQSFWPVTRTFLHRYNLNQLENAQKEDKEKRYPVPKFNWVMVKLGKKEGGILSEPAWQNLPAGTKKLYRSQFGMYR